MAMLVHEKDANIGGHFPRHKNRAISFAIFLHACRILVSESCRNYTRRPGLQVSVRTAISRVLLPYVAFFERFAKKRYIERLLVHPAHAFQPKSCWRVLDRNRLFFGRVGTLFPSDSACVLVDHVVGLGVASRGARRPCLGMLYLELQNCFSFKCDGTCQSFLLRELT